MTDWTPVQANSTQTGSGTSNSLAFAAPVTSGNGVAVWLLLQNAAFGGLPVDVSQVTDDKGNAYRIVSTGNDFATGGLVVAQARSLHPVTNGPQTITATTVQSTTVFWMAIAELGVPTGCTDISLSGQQYMVADTGAVLPNFQVLDPDAFVIGCSFSSGVSTTGAGFTPVLGSGTAICIESKIQSTPTNTMSVLWATQTNKTWAAAMAIAPVAQKRWEPIQRVINRNTTNSTTCVISFPNPVGAGNMVVGSIACDNGGLTHLTSLQDDKGQNYSLVSGTLNSGQGTGDRQTWWSNGLLNNGPKTVTATYNVSQAVNFLIMDEFAPPPGTVSVAIDGTPTNTFNNVVQTTVTTPNVTTAKSSDLAYGWGDNGGGADKPVNSFSATNGQSVTWMTGYFITGSAGPYNFACNCASGPVDASLAIFSSQAATPALLYREDHRPKAYPSGTIGAITPSDTTVITPTCSVLCVSCTVAGIVAVRMLDGNVALIPVPVGFKALEIQYDQVKASGTTATATFVGLYNL